MPIANLLALETARRRPRCAATSSFPLRRCLAWPTFTVSAGKANSSETSLSVGEGQRLACPHLQFRPFADPAALLCIYAMCDRPCLVTS